jgi:hypothetical protein
MPDRPWSKFFWADWESDERLRQCSLAAQGLWMRMLCICAKGEPTGYLAIAGQPLDAEGVARSAGVSTAEAQTLMAELEAWGVFSRDRKGRIYSRRMVKEEKKTKTARKNGRQGGNPALSTSARNERQNPPSDNPRDKGPDKTQRLEARGQRLESSSVGSNEPTGAGRPERGGEKRDPDAALYDRGREVLGPKGGGLVTKLKKQQGSIAKARSVIEEASEKSNPTEYVNAILHKRRSDEPRLGEILM